MVLWLFYVLSLSLVFLPREKKQNIKTAQLSSNFGCAPLDHYDPTGSGNRQFNFKQSESTKTFQPRKRMKKSTNSLPLAVVAAVRAAAGRNHRNPLSEKANSVQWVSPPIFRLLWVPSPFCLCVCVISLLIFSFSMKFNRNIFTLFKGQFFTSQINSLFSQFVLSVSAKHTLVHEYRRSISRTFYFSAAAVSASTHVVEKWSMISALIYFTAATPDRWCCSDKSRAPPRDGTVMINTVGCRSGAGDFNVWVWLNSITVHLMIKLKSYHQPCIWVKIWPEGSLKNVRRSSPA